MTPGRNVWLAAIGLIVFTFNTPILFATDVITISTIDDGGQRTTSAKFVMDGSVGGIGGISGASTDTNKNGYIGQFTEAVSVSVTSTPTQINEGNTSQLSGIATVDDQTITALPGSAIVWSPVAYPLYSVSSNGLLITVANVYASPVGTVTGYYLGASNNASVEVLGPYASTVIPDSWYTQYFGSPPNPLAAPTSDADGTGQNNLFKWVAGLNPTSSASIFTLKITSVTGQPSEKNLIFNPIASGRTYTPQFTSNLVSTGYANLTGPSSPQTNGNQVTVTDLAATGTGKFYRVNISYP